MSDVVTNPVPELAAVPYELRPTVAEAVDKVRAGGAHVVHVADWIVYGVHDACGELVSVRVTRTVAPMCVMEP